MEHTPNYLELEDKHWYDKQWLVVLILFLFWPIGLYGLIKSSSRKGILVKFFGIILIIVFVIATKTKDNDPNSYDSRFDGAVRNSQWDGSVEVAEHFLKRNLLKDPGSYESITWGKVTKNSDGTYRVTHTFRSRNGFGGMGKETITFIISSDGSRIIRCF